MKYPPGLSEVNVNAMLCPSASVIRDSGCGDTAAVRSGENTREVAPPLEVTVKVSPVTTEMDGVSVKTFPFSVMNVISMFAIRVN